MEGWIKLHRKFLEWEWFCVDEMVKLFIYLLLSANYEEKSWRGIIIKRGQIITGINSLHEKTKISHQTLRTCISRLEKTGEINRQSTNKYTIITICNYDSYQDLEIITNNQTNKQLTNDQQTTNKQLTTTKEIKNNKKDKKKEEELFLIYPFNSDEFKNSWQLWIRYKSEQFKFKYKSVITEQAALNDLTEISKGDEETAIYFIKHAISKGWKGIYEPNDYKNGNKQRTNGTGATDEQLANTIAKHFATDAK